MNDDLLERVRGALADRYAVEHRLGTGGMATVYLARDLRYDRAVAIKVLRPDLSATLGSDRFLREIRITAQLNHPHILPLLDSGDAGGLLYYVMPYVAGGSLRHVIQHGPQISTEEVVRVAAQVASALDHAHRQGIVHRDIKPENILLSEGHAVVADFGIARALSSAAEGESLTRSGFPLGTPGYMSPEQATGTLALDARTDVFGLACVVYEMLVGETPEMWPTEQAVRLGRFVDASPDHRDRLDRLPGRLQQALVRGLAIRPADRFATPTELVEALGATARHSPALSEADVQAVLHRAAELQLANPTEDPALSVGAVEQVAADVGIPPEHVRQALAERQHGVTPPLVVGRPSDSGSLALREGRFSVQEKRFRVDRVVDREVNPIEFPTIVAEITETLGLAGHASIIGKSLTWSPAAQGPEGRTILVTVTALDGRTTIHVEERFALRGFWGAVPGMAGGGGALIGLLLGFGLGGGPGPHGLIPAVLCAAGSAFLAFRGVITTMANVAAPQLVALAGRIEARVAGRKLPPIHAASAAPALPPAGDGG